MSGTNIVLGVSGSVACYRACDLARELMRQGASVRVCLTDSAQKFVSQALFEALTGEPCLQDAFEEPVRGRMAHIDWAREADLLLIAPATANVVNKLANGIGDDMLTTIALAFDGPVVMAPAMNPTMYADETTRASLRVLEARGAVLVEPSAGEVACGEQGQGKLASTMEIAASALAVVHSGKLLAGKKILLTSGPTQEPIDDVRFLSNRSSGKMGAALARAALLMGAEVTVVSGPSTAVMPLKAIVRSVKTGKEMLQAALAEIDSADLVIGAAAVADFTVVNRVTGKLRRSDGVPALELEPNPDVIAELAKRAKASARVVAFAAEPGDGLEEARAKMAKKGVSAIVVNDVSDPAIGFESDENELVLITAERTERSPRLSKLQCALWLLKELGGQ